jgi:DNA topoisomerase-1
VAIRDRRLARIVARTQELPGQELFEYVDDDGEARTIRSEDVNDYLRDIAGAEVTSKMFRAWGATLLAVRALSSGRAARSPRLARRGIVAAMKEVAEQLGDTPAIARGSYVHPAVLDAYVDGGLPAATSTDAIATSMSGTRPRRAEEVALIRLLERAARSRGRRAA